MAHSIHVGFLSVNEFVAKILATVEEKNIISAKNIYVSDDRPEQVPGYQARGLSVLADDSAVLLKSEIAVIAASKRELGTVLAPLCALTRGKILIVLSEGADCDYVLERVARGTFVACAAPTQSGNGVWLTNIDYSAGFPDYMKSACEDIVGVISSKE